MIVTTLVGITLVGCSSPRLPRSAQHPLLGQRLPYIGPQTTVLGADFDASELHGRPVFFKFFAEYCVPCKESLPAFQKLHQKHRDVQFVGVDEDNREEAAMELMNEFGLTFPVITDTDKVLSDRFEVTTLPTSFAADASGVIRWVGSAGQSEQDLKHAVAALR